VIIFLSGVFNLFNIVYKVVVFHEPVGQVTSIIQLFFDIAFSIILLLVQKNHKSSKLTIAFELSKSLETTFSQYFVGKVETLTSNFFSQESPFNFTSKSYFQSWGIFVIFNFKFAEYLSLSNIDLYSAFVK